MVHFLYVISHKNNCARLTKMEGGGDNHIAERLVTIHLPVTVNAKASAWMSFFGQEEEEGKCKIKKTFHATNKFISNCPKRIWKEFGIEWSRSALEI